MESAIAARLRRPSGPLLRPLPAAVRRRLSRRHALIAIAAVALLSGGYLLFRDSPFVAVERVQVVGVSGPDGAAISQSLDVTAKGMSTLHYSESALIASVARYQVVRALRVRTSFPHTMKIEVSEQLPVAALSANGVRTAVAANGVVLGPTLLKRSLPSIPIAVVPAVGRKIGDAKLRSYLAILGATPTPLLAVVSKVFDGKQGITVQMRNGLLIYFGDATRPHAKWDSMVTVLSMPGSAGASYVDVRLPERPAVGAPGGGIGSGESAQVSASDPTSAALAASLAKAVNGEPVSPPEATQSEGAAASASEGQGGGAAASGSGGQSEGAATSASEGQGEGAAAGAPEGKGEGGAAAASEGQGEGG